VTITTGGKTGYYNKTYSKTTKLGARLTTTSGTFRRVGVIAFQCPTCGRIGIYSGTTLIKSWSLKSSSSKLGNWISPLLSSRKAVVTIKALSAGKQSVIDAIGLQR
jgi:hypothetical protein